MDSFALWSRDNPLGLEPDSYPAVARNPDRIVDHVAQNVRPGSIILLRVETRGRATGKAALPKLIAALRHSGYEMATVAKLLERAAQQ